MKILGIYRKNGGSFHRVWLPLIGIAEFEETINEEILEKVKPDVVYIHWTSPISIPELSILKAKYGFKVIADIDDTWHLPKKYDIQVFQSKNLCIFADGVICTNYIIENEVKLLNNNTTIIPNYLPRSNIVKQKPEKFVVGLYGSIEGHFQNWMSLKSEIEKMLSDKELMSKIEFKAAGFDGKSEWFEIQKMFKGNIGFIPAVLPEQSLSILSQFDILLCPLLNTPLNEARSNLKIEECAYERVIPIIGTEYFKKDDINRLLPCEDFYQMLRSIVFDNIYEEEIKILEHINNRIDYNEECVTKRIAFIENTNKEESDIAQIYSIVYDENQTGEYIKYLNPIKTIQEKSYLFEYNPMITLSDFIKSDSKYFGIFSYKFPMKTGFYKKIIERILHHENADVVVFCKQHNKYFKWTEKQHPGFLRTFKMLCKKLELEVPKNPDVTIYSNFFVAKPEIYKEYIEVVKKAIDIMENDPEISKLCWKDSKYKSGLSKEDLKKYTGLDYYSFHTFLLERLICVFLHNKNYITSIYY